MTSVEVVQSQLDAYNARDLQRFLAAYGEQVDFRAPSGTAAISGKPALAAYYATQRFNRAGLHAEVVNRLVLGNKVIDHERVAAVRDQPFEAAAVYEVIDGLIRSVWFFAAD